MMRIAHVYKDAFPPTFGGIEQHVALLARLQAAAGHDVRIIAAGAAGRAEHVEVGAVRYTRLPEMGRVASSPVTARFVGALRHLDADVAHFHHPNPVGELGELGLSSSCRRVVSYHADITRQLMLGRLYRPLLRRFLERADVVIASSPPLLASSPLLAPHRTRTRVVPYGVEAPPVHEPVPREPGRLLFVGRLREYKGLPVLLEALAQLPRAHLRIVGRGPLEQTLRARASTLGVARRTRFLGDLSEAKLDDEYRRARVVVLPSTRRSEAFGIVLAEALARATPCLTTELGTGTSWVNLEGVTGCVVPPGDAPALAHAAETLDDATLWARYSAGARERAKLFTAEGMAEHVLAAYRDA